MDSLKDNYSVFERFNFERPPVAVNYSMIKPKGIARIDRSLHICEMIGEAHKGKPFYATKDDIMCIGPLILGMVQNEIVFENGFMGAKLGMYKNARANKRLYQIMPRMPVDSVRYVVFSPIEKTTMDPDVLIITAEPNQASVFQRAITYSNGGIIHGRVTNGGGCSWVFVYPYISGEVNFLISGFGMGLGLPSGKVILSIPFNLLPMIISNLNEMEWPTPMEPDDLPELKRKVDELHRDLLAEIGEKPS